MANLVDEVMAEFPLLSEPDAVEALGCANGFSGAEFWRVTVGEAVYCLRQWPPEHPSQDQLRWIHAVLQHVHQHGVHYIPVPLPNRRRQTFVWKAGRLWEATYWLPGEANFHAEPSRQKLENALRALAQWHLTAADFDTGCSSPPGPAAGMLRRQQRYLELCNGGIDRLSAAVEQPSSERTVVIARELIHQFRQRAPRSATRLAAACQLKVTRQPCIRDIWHDHVLYVNDRVTGIVDFGAMRLATVAGDVARLLGSLVAGDAAMWTVGIRAYESVRPLKGDEGPLIDAWNLANALLSGLQWVEWLFVEQRFFANIAAVERRMRVCLDQLSSCP